MPGPVPAYATDVLGHPKVDACLAPEGDLSAFYVTSSIAHFRPRMWIWPRGGPGPAGHRYTPRPHRVSNARLLQRNRALVRVQAGNRESASSVDGVLASSEEARTQIRLERLAIDETAFSSFPWEPGTSKATKTPGYPTSCWRGGFAQKQFVVVLGTNYTHKNRDVAVRVVEELRERGRAISLVLAGAANSHGSSRQAEIEAGLPNDWVFVIPDVLSAERNWLLKHGGTALYPTSAEGFGLIPHEAAAFGTPTVMVPFGPFAERLADLPVAPPDWEVKTLADACLRLLSDPAEAQAQVEALRLSEDQYDWRASAAGTVKAYQSLLARPSRYGE